LAGKNNKSTEKHITKILKKIIFENGNRTKNQSRDFIKLVRNIQQERNKLAISDNFHIPKLGGNLSRLMVTGTAH